MKAELYRQTKDVLEAKRTTTSAGPGRNQTPTAITVAGADKKKVNFAGASRFSQMDDESVQSQSAYGGSFQ